ncbi:MAG: histidine kinase dimerization/phospho-acceptor domain-containing protein [Microcoleaceae cyanobacterium]
MKPPRAKLLPTPLARLITVPFLIQIFLAVGLTGWFAFRNGQQAIDNILGELNEIVVKQVEIDLRTYLNSAHRINQFLISNLRTEVLSLENETELRQYFLGSSQAHPRTLGVGLGTADGEVIGIDRWPAGFEGSTSADPHVLFRAKDGTLRIWGVDEQANPVKLIETKPFDPRDRPWYQVAAQTSSPVWSEIYNTATSDELVIAASQGVYDSQNELLGVASVSIKLDEIGAIIQQLEVGKAGEIFIIERNGLLVASSNPEDKLMTKTPDGEPERILATDSKNTLIQQTAQQIEQQFDSLDAINTEVHFRAQVVDQFQSIDVIPVQVVPFADSKGLDWLVVLVISRSEFNQEIYEAVRRTIFLCAATLALATILGLLTTHLITRPIRKLVQASQNIADGDLGQTVQVSGIRELENLSHSFNEMADQLKHSFESLETQVEERTLQLKDTNLMLREEIQEHQQTEEQLKQATARANQANQAKSQFLANMSHELRTPLNAILGFAQIMNRDRSLSSEQRRNLGIINNSGQHLLGLINDILDVSKIEAGRMTLETSSFDLYQLLETLEQTFSLKVKSKGLDFRFEREADVPQFIETDEGKLRQILTNLLSNATKFTEIGEIALRVSRSFNTFNNSVNGSTVNPSPNPRPNQAHSAIGNQPTDFQFSDPIALQFAVSDTGQGISPEEQKNLFEAFVQTETGRKSQEGTGLGLTIS